MASGGGRPAVFESCLRIAEQAFADMPIPIYLTDSDGVLAYCNDAAIQFAGHTPRIGADKWCICWRAYDMDGSLIDPENGPMAMTLRTSENVRGVIALAQRPDGSRQAFMPFPSVLRDEQHTMVGGFNAFYPLNERAEAAVLSEPDEGRGPTID